MTTSTIDPRNHQQQQPLSPQYIRQRPPSMSQMMRTSYFSCTTYSEFTGHRGQQHSAPVHPPHPSRSSLAVARSLSERSKEDKCFESSFSDVPTGGHTKSMADQIDEVMEQLNANCDFSMDDLFGATNSASTSTLNAPQIGPDGKPIKSKKQQLSGLTKKSQSASQLSVSGVNRKTGKVLKKSYSQATNDDPMNIMGYDEDGNLSDRSKGSTTAGTPTTGLAHTTGAASRQTRTSKLSSKLAKSKMIPFSRHNKQSISSGYYYGGIQRSEEILPESFITGTHSNIRAGKENLPTTMDFNIQSSYGGTGSDVLMDSPLSLSASSSIAGSMRYESSGSGGGDGNFIGGGGGYDGSRKQTVVAQTVISTTTTTSTSKTITDSDSEIWMPQQSRPSQSSVTVAGGSGEGEFSNFVEGLGPGQIVEVIRARGLQSKQSAKMIPAPFVKVYLFRKGKCISKAKTQMARRTLDPLFQQQLLFTDNYKGCILHVVVNGLYGRMDKKSFMGVVQIVLDDLDLSNIVIGWYKLFSESSAISLPTQSSTKSGGGGGSVSGAASLMSASMDSFS
ncbi:hypothetical protein BLA29_000461 [Euroglyphus maynei]|uniref:C2 domain-containing protein n=1 Tax=Euroglyphus maynei TaxID=6958 RepID=A0A1Y3BRD7_EURMA|nr:hypothetical protein BLA29_000461 [Euroglyphus maynei]